MEQGFCRPDACGDPQDAKRGGEVPCPCVQRQAMQRSTMFSPILCHKTIVLKCIANTSKISRERTKRLAARRRQTIRAKLDRVLPSSERGKPRRRGSILSSWRKVLSWETRLCKTCPQGDIGHEEIGSRRTAFFPKNVPSLRCVEPHCVHVSLQALERGRAGKIPGFSATCRQAGHERWLWSSSRHLAGRFRIDGNGSSWPATAG